MDQILKNWNTLKIWFSESSFNNRKKTSLYPYYQLNDLLDYVPKLLIQEIAKGDAWRTSWYKKNKVEFISMYVQFLIWCLLVPALFISCSSEELFIRKRFSELFLVISFLNQARIIYGL